MNKLEEIIKGCPKNNYILRKKVKEEAGCLLSSYLGIQCKYFDRKRISFIYKKKVYEMFRCTKNV